MRALVTGGGGFLGLAIVARLLDRGAEVRTFSRRSYPELDALGVDHRVGDLGDRAAVAAAVAGCDVVFHNGALAGAWGPYDDYYRANVVGTKHVVEACRSQGVGRLVYTSSPSVVFNGADMAGVDESVPYAAHFDAPYPETKAIAEAFVLASSDTDLATTALRPHLIFGPRDPHLVPRLVDRARSGRLSFIGDGENLIDITYVDNAADAHVLAADALTPDGPVAGRPYFITNGEPRSIRSIFGTVTDIHGLPPVRRRVPVGVAKAGGRLLETAYARLGLGGEPLVTRFLAEELATTHWFDISAARRDFGYVPQIGLDEGFERVRAALGTPAA
jgi:nucleoside-diphosphate-sugar epimerase